MATALRELQPPYGTVAYDDGTVVLVDSIRHCLRVLNNDGSERCAIGGRGSRFDQFLRPKGMCRVGRNLVCVCDSGNRRLSFVDIHQEAVVKAFGGLVCPVDVTFIPSNGLLAVVDSGKTSLDFYDLEGELRQTVRHQCFSHPFQILSHPISGNLFITDSKDSDAVTHEFTVKVWSKELLLCL